MKHLHLIIMKANQRTHPDKINFNKSYPDAIAIIGIDIKKEKRAAAFRVNPSIKPAVIVMPEREVPGISANACAKPKIIAPFSPV